jgi:prepilin-type N-terminal cleavage/methylation domain-containing protein
MKMYTKRTERVLMGFTLVELLVVIAIIGVLVGLVMPATQSLREMARRSTCQQNLIELSLALAAYHDTQDHYPAGTINSTGPIQSVESGFHHNWISGILPHLESQAVHDAINFQAGVYAPENALVRQATFPFLLCPSATFVNLNTSCYAGIHHSTEAPIDESNDGVFILNRVTSNRDIVDGLSYTLFLGEKKSVPEFDLGWMSGTRSTLRNTGHAIGAVGGAWPHLILSQPTEPVEPIDPYGYGSMKWALSKSQPRRRKRPLRPLSKRQSIPSMHCSLAASKVIIPVAFTCLPELAKLAFDRLRWTSG